MSELRRLMREFLWEEDAVGVVEIILILVVLIALVMIFKDQLTSLVKNISFTKDIRSAPVIYKESGSLYRMPSTSHKYLRSSGVFTLIFLYSDPYFSSYFLKKSFIMGISLSFSINVRKAKFSKYLSHVISGFLSVPPAESINSQNSLCTGTTPPTATTACAPLVICPLIS